MVHFTIDAPPAVTEEVKELAREAGGEARLPGKEGTAELVGRFDPHTRVQEGDAVRVTVDPAGLHFFDPETSLTIDGRGPTSGGTA
jgi:hypothetical protein